MNYTLSFNNKNFESKMYARTEKNYRNSKNMKKIGKERKDALSDKIYCDSEEGHSLLPKKSIVIFLGLLVAIMNYILVLDIIIAKFIRFLIICLSHC